MVEDYFALSGGSWSEGKEQAPETGQAHVTGKTPRINFFQTWKIILSSLTAFPHLQDTQLSNFFSKLFYSIPHFPDSSAESS